ncbi:SE1561 family protein [Peribacillus simplex]|uniref:SE1561 family protein n=1 Tax=Peribacillus TaxID=2675229 RepID=UPI002955CC7F|nr:MULTISPECIES: SE1561 family protein [Peribacillus]MDV7764197.1 SE1561 family protein [Peribacillus sp. CSMR9]MDW7617243.1 SE1561 family protein [Peribacillus simplex]
MGKSITGKNEQLTYLKERLTMFMEVLDHIEPENTELEDIDRLIGMIDDLEGKVEQFRTREE